MKQDLSTIRGMKIPGYCPQFFFKGYRSCTNHHGQGGTLLTPKSVTIHVEHQSSTLLGDTKSTQSGGESSEDDKRDSEDKVRDKGESGEDEVRDKGESGEDEGRVMFGKIKHHVSLRFFFSKSKSLLISSHHSILVSYRHLHFSYIFTFAFSSHLHQDHWPLG